MDVEKNSLSILIGYLILTVSQMIVQKICWGSKILYLVLTIVSLIGAFILWKLNHKYKCQNIIDTPKTNFKKILLWGIIGTVLIIGGQFVTLNLCHFLLHQPLSSQNTNAFLTIFRQSPIYLIDIVVVTPIVEELIFRKVLFGNLTYYFNFWIAAFISSFLFGIAHHDGHFLTYFVMGCLLEFIYYMAHDIRSSIIAHAGLNLIVLIIAEIH